MVRISRDGDLPLHFEASPLEISVRAFGWPAAMVLTVAGIATFVRAGSMAVEAAAAFLILVGGSLVAALVRCRRYEITVGRRMLELRLGPFRRILPVGSVEGAKPGPANSWRRLFADRQLELTLSIESRPLVIPTHEENELRAALVHHRGPARSRGDTGPGNGT